MFSWKKSANGEIEVDNNGKLTIEALALKALSEKAQDYVSTNSWQRSEVAWVANTQEIVAKTGTPNNHNFRHDTKLFEYCLYQA